NTEMQVAYAGVGSHYAGGLTKSWEQTYAAGIIATRGPNWDGEIELQWRFQKQRQWCMTASGYGATYRDSGKRPWLPPNLPMGNRNRVDDWSWTCDRDFAAYIENQAWVARSSTVRWVHWFEIAGVELDSIQTNSAAHRLSVLPLPGRRVHVCGSNDDPSKASA